MSISSRVGALAIAIIAVAIGATIYFAKFSGRNPNELNLRLEWYPQAQFAGYIVADRLGYYADEGLKVNIRPAGPDLKPMSTVADGTDDIGIGVSNQVALARSNGVPVKVIAQIFQDSANRYVLLSKNRINSLTNLRGKKVGLWLGGDEAEFVAMLASAGMNLSDVQVIPQGESVAPFLNGDYVLSEVTIYNELIQIENQLGNANSLQIVSPGEYNSAIVGDMIFVKESTVRDRRDQLVRFLRASLRGWRFAIQNPDKAVDLILAANPELNRDEQQRQLQAIIQLMLKGTSLNDIGKMNSGDYETMIRVLKQSGQLIGNINAADIYDGSILLAAESKN
jgi:NitT/TauT family transport system substrate-binding protein